MSMDIRLVHVAQHTLSINLDKQSPYADVELLCGDLVQPITLDELL